MDAVLSFTTETRPALHFYKQYSTIHYPHDVWILEKAKDRMTALVACSAMGEKLKLLVIGRSAKPRAFQGYKLSSLGVTYTSNKKAWMTSQIFSDWLTSINNKMRIQGRNILMLIDNCSAHPELQMSNVKLVFLPPNTTSKLQPCDAGIIQNLKQLYRKRMMRSILMNMEDCKTATELAKKITVLDAILWLRYAWDMVSNTTIQKCFTEMRHWYPSCGRARRERAR